MNSLIDVHNKLNEKDLEILEKQAEMNKEAEEADAAGRIMARGFADELNKLAAPEGVGPGTGGFGGGGGETIKAKPAASMTGGAPSGPKVPGQAGPVTKPTVAPPAQAPKATAPLKMNPGSAGPVK